MQTAVGYVRVSSDAQAKMGESLSMQRDAIVRHAEAKGYRLLAVFEDAGISGGKSEKGRPGLTAALGAIESGAAQVFIVKHADRLSRDSELAGFLRVTVKRAGARLDIIEAKTDRQSQAVDTFTSELERLRGCERMIAWHREKAIRGERTGRLPVESKPGCDSLRERVLTLRATKASLRDIASTLNAEGFTTAAQKAFRASTVARLLARAA